MNIDLEDLKEEISENKGAELGIFLLLKLLDSYNLQSGVEQKELSMKVENLEKETAYLKGQLSVILKGD